VKGLNLGRALLFYRFLQPFLDHMTLELLERVFGIKGVGMSNLTALLSQINAAMVFLPPFVKQFREA
jgi:4-hydroxyphenylpyruvate dioxygenase-like putative hemolysin